MIYIKKLSSTTNKEKKKKKKLVSKLQMSNKKSNGGQLKSWSPLLKIELCKITRTPVV